MANGNQLPEGFVLDSPGASPVESQALPQGFVLDQPAQQPQIAQQPEPEIEGGGLEAAATMASGMAAMPVAGVIGAAAAPFVGPEGVEFMIKDIQERLTYLPKTPEGVARLEQISKFLEPVIEKLEQAEEFTGEKAFEAAGGETAPTREGAAISGAAGTLIPTVAMEAMGVGAIRRALGSAKLAKTAKKLVTPSAQKLLKEAAPTIEGLKQAARGVYKEIDDLGITINPRSVTRLSNELQSVAKNEGFNARIHPKVAAVLDEFKSVKGSPQTLTEIDILRKVARGAARSADPDEARIGSILIERIDNTLDNLKNANFANPSKADVGAKYKDARQLWGRAKRSELVEDAFTKAGLQASGFENGIRVQFRSILNNKKKRAGFSPEEIQAMRDVVKGTSMQNMAKAIGKFGFTEGQATTMLMGSLGVAGGAMIGGGPGAVAVPLIGQVSKTLAQKLTRGNAEGVDAIVRAGKDGKKVVDAYLKSTKKSERSPQELTELLMRPDISLEELKSKIPKLPKEQRQLVTDALFFVTFLESQKQQNNQIEE